MKCETILSDFVAREIYCKIVKRIGRRKGLWVTLGYPDITTMRYWRRIGHTPPYEIWFRATNHTVPFVVIIAETLIALETFWHLDDEGCHCHRITRYNLSNPSCFDDLCRKLEFELDLNDHTLITTWWGRLLWWFSNQW